MIIFLLAFTGASAKEIDIEYDPGLPSRGDTSKSDWNRNHGSIATILGDSVRKLRVRHYNDHWWKDSDEVCGYLKSVLEDEGSQTFEAPTWQQPFTESVEAEIEFTNGKRGIWVVDGRLSCFQDSTGKYWFAMHQQAWDKLVEAHNKPAQPTTAP